jgi:hypothetical protein
METQAHTSRRRWSWRTKVLLQLALLPVWFLTAEALFRGWSWIGGKPYHAEEARVAIANRLAEFTSIAPIPRQEDQKLEPETLNFFRSWHPHPFYGFENDLVASAIQQELDRRHGPRDAHEYTICIVGGSVAMLFRPEGTDALREKLLLDPRFAGRTIRFLDCGQPAHKEPQQLMLFAYLLELGITPDALINLDGFNEAAFAWGNILDLVNPTYPELAIWAYQARSDADDRASIDLLLDIREMQRQVIGIARFALRYRLYESSLLGRMTLSRLGWRSARTSWKRSQYVAGIAGKESSHYLGGPKILGGTQAAVDAAVRAWVESSRSLQDLCRGRSIYYLHVLQPTLHDEGSKPLTASEIAGAGNNSIFSGGVHAIYPRLREEGQALRKEGVNFYDCSMAFATLHEPVYYDHCHFKALGNEIVAARIAEAFLANVPSAKEMAQEHSGR